MQFNIVSCVQNIGLILCNFAVLQLTRLYGLQCTPCCGLHAAFCVTAYTAVWIAIINNITTMEMIVSYSLHGCMDYNRSFMLIKLMTIVIAYTVVWIAIV